MAHQRLLLTLFAVAVLSACASSNFTSSWKSPTAQPLNVKGASVAAAVMMGDGPSRRSAEDKLASEITARGAKGVPMYKIMPNVLPGDEATARKALREAGVAGVVVLQPTTEAGKHIDYAAPPYSTYWNSGYYHHAAGQPTIDPQGIPYDTVVTVETLIYSLNQNQLVWAGKSRKTNPASLNGLVSELAKDTAKELREQGLIAQ